MTLYSIGLLYDGQTEPDEWHSGAATGPATGGRIAVGVKAPRDGRARMVMHRATGGPILWSGELVDVRAGDVVNHWFEMGGLDFELGLLRLAGVDDQ